jgi:fructose-bisphosphate aldolase class 1
LGWNVMSWFQTLLSRGLISHRYAPGKGITACDEGPGTIGMRFEAVGVVNTEAGG